MYRNLDFFCWQTVQEFAAIMIFISFLVWLVADEVGHQILEQYWTKIFLKELDHVPNSEVSVVCHVFYVIVREMSVVKHSLDIANTHTSHQKHCGSKKHIDNGQSEHNNEPEVEERKYFLVYDILRQEAETIVTHY